uniref:Uncharacterized protein n=1 Tax=Mus musculus TaxID=10090 RepID=Q9D373_MOUSE|nr:unnamed protein product [Mus musculus]
MSSGELKSTPDRSSYCSLGGAGCLGPDICGFDIKKVHVILYFKNQYHENKKPIRCKVDGFTHLYTLILRPDLSYEVKVDGQSIESGSIEYDWNLTSLRKTEKTSLDSRDWDQVEGSQVQDWESTFWMRVPASRVTGT